MKRQASSTKAKRVALSAVLAACSLVLLYLASYLPSGKMGMAAAAGLFPAAAVVSCGFGAGFLCYVGTAILGMLLVSDKAVALLYLLFFGLYPMIKGFIERMNRLVPELILKLLIFNGYAVILFRVFGSLFMAMGPGKDLPSLVLLLLGNVVFLLYDYGFSKIITFYLLRVDRMMR